MKVKLLIITLTVTSLLGCAPRPAVRAEFTALPSLEKGFGRMYISAGTMSGVDLWSDHQVGPVFINQKNVGSTAKDEHIAVDLLAGTYEVYCTQNKPEKNLIEKRKITIQDRKSSYYACQMEMHGAGGFFGALGALASEYITKSYIDEGTLENPNSRLVSYLKFRK